MKQTIRLRESELKRIIAESVKRVLRESKSDFDIAMNRHGKLPKGYDKSLTVDDFPSIDALAGLNKHYESEILPYVKDREIKDSWDDFDYENWERYGKDPYNDVEVGLRDYNFDPNLSHYLSWDEEFTDAEHERDKQNKKYDKGVQAADRRWKKAADSRPLHRKGSLNRTMGESINRKISRIVKESVNKILNESAKTSLRSFMKVWYNHDDSCIDALERLTDNAWLHSMGWYRVFHEGIGEGVYSPEEGIVAVFDEDGLPTYHSYQLYKYNPKAWKSCDGDGWDRIYDGDNGEGFDVEPLNN